MKNLEPTFDFSSKKIKIKPKSNPNKPMIPNEILSKKIKLKADLPSPPRVVKEEISLCWRAVWLSVSLSGWLAGSFN